jgi:serralysin
VDVVARDADTDTLTYSVTSDLWINPENGIVTKLNIATSAGVLNGRLYFTAKPDYEAKSSFSGTVTVSDGTNSVTQDITVTINNLNDNTPSITSGAAFTADENQTAIGTVTASDADGDALTYSISGSEININSSSGVLTFASAPDYETKSSYSATVTVTDGTNSVTQDITVLINDLNDRAPIFASSASFTVNENQTAIGTVTATDADGDTITFSISGSEININSSTGVLTFASAPDYETKSSYSATVTATDGTNISTQNISVSISDVNETPTFTSSTSFTADENQTAIGTVTAIDADGDTLTYSISGSEININSSSGALTFVSAPDYETKSSYSATVTATDGALSTTQNITVSIANLNDNSPVITSANSFSVVEGISTSFATVSANDVDGDSLSYSISGEDQSKISINASRELFLSSVPNYENPGDTGSVDGDHLFEFTVEVNDGSNTTAQDVTVEVTNDISISVSLGAGSSQRVHVFDTAKSCISASCNSTDIMDWIVTREDRRAQYDPRVVNYWGNTHDFATSTFPDWWETGMGITDIGAAAVDVGAFVSNWGNANRAAGDNIHIYRYIIGGSGGVTVEETVANTSASTPTSYGRAPVDIDALVTSAGSEVGKYVEISEDGNTIAFSNNPAGANSRIEIFRTSDGTRHNFSSIGPLEGSHWTFSQAGFLLSNDGNRIAVLWDTNGSGAAGISVYEYSAGSWSKVGNDITGFSYPSSTENAYKNMAINHDGTMVGFVENQTGIVYIYKETSGTWSEHVTPFNKNGTDLRSGATSFDFNSYGNVIAVVEDNCFDIQIYDDVDTYDKLTRYCLGTDIDVGDAATTITDLILTDTRSILNIDKTPDSSEYSQVHLKTTDNLHWVFMLNWNNP